MQVQLNGEPRQLQAETRTLLDVLGEIELDPRTVAIELSGQVVPRSEFGETQVHDGDRIEVVRFVQGG